MKRLFVPLVLIAVACVLSLRSVAQEATRPFVPVTDEMLQKPDPANWLSWRRTTDSQGFSPLNQINRDNVAKLQQTWMRSIGNGTGNHEGTPLVYNGVMYIPNPGDYIMAVDAKTGELNLGVQAGHAAVDQPQHGDLGHHAHRRQLRQPDVRRRRAHREAGVGDAGLRSEDVGQRQLRPDHRQRQGDRRPPVPAAGHQQRLRDHRTRRQNRQGSCGGRARSRGRASLATKRWGDVPLEERWHVGTWMVPSYDPVLNLVIVGTSVTIPAPKFILGGNDKEHLYHNSTLAIDADTGKIVWHYQHVVDHWDLDHPFERLLVDTAVAPDPKEVPWINPRIKPGERRLVVTGIPGKTGVVYTIDRQDRRIPLGAADGLSERDLEDRRRHRQGHGQSGDPLQPDRRGAVRLPELERRQELARRRLTTRRRNVMFYPLQNTVHDGEDHDRQARPGGASMASACRPAPAPKTENVGAVYAISVETGRTLWKYEQRAGMLSLVATGGGLVFGGDANGRFMAFDERTGKILWETNLGAPVSGYPIAFAVNGKQYIAVNTGGSLVAGSVNRIAELKLTNSTNMFVFALP